MKYSNPQQAAVHHQQEPQMARLIALLTSAGLCRGNFVFLDFRVPYDSTDPLPHGLLYFTLVSII